jgi:SAM-dependent methyltransferase
MLLSNLKKVALPAPTDRVPETRFGTWFLGTDTWSWHVLRPAVTDLFRLTKLPPMNSAVLLDAGCGRGRSFALLNEFYSPRHLIAVDADPAILRLAEQEAKRYAFSFESKSESLSRLSVTSESVDAVFCHQTFHHLTDQHQTLREFYRVLKPGGLLLFAESTRRYIHSWIIRLLFRHPMDVQRSAGEYIDMIRGAGFDIPNGSVSFPYSWWSRPDFGIREAILGMHPPADREETLVNLVAVRR